MEVELLRREENLITVKVRGETHTLLAPIADLLQDMDEVLFAGFDVPHPLKEEGVLTVRVKEGVSPEEVVFKALDSLKRIFSTVKSDLETQLKKSAQVEVT